LNPSWKKAHDDKLVPSAILYRAGGEAVSIYRAIMRKLVRFISLAPHMITCRQFEDFIIDYLDGELPTRQQRVFKLHLRFCPECRIYLAAYERTVALGKAVFDEPDGPVPDTVPTDLVKAILAAQKRDSANN
jgi:hypothetical protein